MLPTYNKVTHVNGLNKVVKETGHENLITLKLDNITSQLIETGT